MTLFQATFPTLPPVTFPQVHSTPATLALISLRLPSSFHPGSPYWLLLALRSLTALLGESPRPLYLLLGILHLLAEILNP
jgi:hypothetical protein